MNADAPESYSQVTTRFLSHPLFHFYIITILHNIIN